MAKASTKKKQKKKGSAETDSGGMSAKKRKSLKDAQFAFPEQRKVPLNDASHVRNAAARFDQVKGVSAEARDKAWKRVKKAAKKMNVQLSHGSWRQLGRKKGRKKAGKKKG